MATTLPPPKIGPPVDIDEELRPHHGNGGGARGLGPEPEGLRRVKDPGGEPTRTGIWVALAAIAMMFAALTSALYVREGSATDWHHITLPPILWFNTLALVASSVALELARRRVSTFMRGQADGPRATFGSTLRCCWAWYSWLGNTWHGCSCARRACIFRPIRTAPSF